MRNHINTVVTRYKGRIKGWDVVNEAILDDGEYRNKISKSWARVHPLASARMKRP